ncbi:MAG: general secretion pathway protein GspB [Woeseiaceae bacterium]
MSFILDALKKSETERQQQSSAEFSSVPASSGNPNPTRWLWMLGLLLFVNFAVLIGILLKPSSTDDAAQPATVAESATATSNDFEEQVAVAIDNQAAQAPDPAPRIEEPPAAITESAPARTTAAPTPSTSSRVSDAVVPTMDELRLEGTLQIAELHLDIHVFSEAPEDRFVFINMNKHREGSKTAEGPVVREIRTDGVLLEYQGRVFLLPRE